MMTKNKKQQHKKCIQFEVGELNKKEKNYSIFFFTTFWPPLLSIIRLVNILLGMKTINASNFHSISIYFFLQGIKWRWNRQPEREREPNEQLLKDESC